MAEEKVKPQDILKDVNEEAPQTVQIDLKTANETVKGLTETIKVLTEKVTNLQIREQNLNNDIHSLQVQKDQVNRNEDTKVSIKLIEGNQKLEADRAELERSRNSFELRETEIEKRIRDVEAREKEVVDIDKSYKALGDERQRFNHYKFNIERELEEAKITIEEAKVEQDRLEGIKREIEGNEVLLKNKWNDFHDSIGELEEKRKSVQMEVEHLEGLKKWYEAHKKEVQDEQSGNRLEEAGQLAGRN